MAKEFQAHELRVISEKQELDGRLLKLREFTATPAFAALDPADQRLLQSQALAMDGYSSILRRRIERFTPIEPATSAALDRMRERHEQSQVAIIAGVIAASEGEDFPLGKACDLSGDTGCEACQ